MIFGTIVDLAVGALLIIFGLLIWKKQKITLLHDYHYKNVKEEDVPAYTRLMGAGIIIIGVGFCLMGVLMFIRRDLFGWIAFIAGFIAGLIIMHKAQKKYNGSWLS